ncbi:unnamed protein product, partial [marine sediment metagenome]
SLVPKERQLWLLRNRSERDKGVQLWNVSFHLFGKLLEKRVRARDDDESWDLFADPEEGSTLKVDFEKVTRGGYTFMDASSIDFKQRKDPLDDGLLESVPCLDELLIIPTYDELKKVFLQIEDEDDKPSKKKKKKKEEPEEEDDDEEDDDDEELTAEEAGLEVGGTVTYDDETHTITRISKDGTSLTLKDEDGDKVGPGIAVDEVEKVVRKKKKTKKKKEEPEDDDDEPVVKKKPKGNYKKCTACGGTGVNSKRTGKCVPCKGRGWIAIKKKDDDDSWDD